MMDWARMAEWKFSTNHVFHGASHSRHRLPVFGFRCKICELVTFWNHHREHSLVHSRGDQTVETGLPWLQAMGFCRADKILYPSGTQRIPNECCPLHKTEQRRCCWLRQIAEELIGQLVIGNCRRTYWIKTWEFTTSDIENPRYRATSSWIVATLCFRRQQQLLLAAKIMMCSCERREWSRVNLGFETAQEKCARNFRALSMKRCDIQFSHNFITWL